MVKSNSPLAALIRVWNFSQTPSNMPSRLLSASVFKKFLTVSALSLSPVYFCNSWTIWDLSLVVRVGVVRIRGNFGSFLKMAVKAARDLDVGSKAEDLTAAVNYSSSCQHFILHDIARNVEGIFLDGEMRAVGIQERSHMFHLDRIVESVVWNLILRPEHMTFVLA